MTVLYAPKPNEQPQEEKDKKNQGTKIEKDNKKTEDQQIKHVEYPPKLKYL